jgi:hypothetical protein
MKRTLLEEINTSSILGWAALALMFLVMLACNMLTGFVADDYTYQYSFATGEKIASVADIFPSMAAHRFSMNGRIIAHFLVQLSFLLPIWIFKLVNSAMLVGAVAWIYLAATKDNRKSNLLLVTIFAAIWAFTPSFGQAILWQDGSINYLWACVFSMLYLLPFINKFMYDKNLKPAISVVLVIFSLPVGWYSENCATAIIFGSILLLILCKFVKKQHIPAYYYVSILFALIGFACMITAPAEAANKGGTLSVSTLINGLSGAVTLYKEIWILLVVYLALAAVAYCGNTVNKDRQILALVFTLCSAASIFVLAAANAQPGRSACFGTLMEIAACAVLLVDLNESKYKPLVLFACCVCLTAGVYCVCVGTADIYSTNYQLNTFKAEILEQKEAGIMDVEVAPPIFRTRFSAGYGLSIIQADSSHWSNAAVAKYFEINTITAAWD